jgi:Rrf2 family nitric oxide-sensitive transcriptional repressor
MEATLAPVDCDAPLCLIQKSCSLRGILFEAQQQFLEHVGRYTLADLAGTRVPLAKLLGKGRGGRAAQA